MRVDEFFLDGWCFIMPKLLFKQNFLYSYHKQFNFKGHLCIKSQLNWSKSQIHLQTKMIKSGIINMLFIYYMKCYFQIEINFGDIHHDLLYI